MSTEELQVMVYDTDLKAPACVLLQAAFGCGASPHALTYFPARHWLTQPTPGMRKIAGTPEQWKQAAALTAATWGDKEPHLPLGLGSNYRSMKMEQTSPPTAVGSNAGLGLRWAEAPRRTEYGAGMMEALVALGKDHTLRLYAEIDVLHLVGPALVAAAVAAERARFKSLCLAGADGTHPKYAEACRQCAALIEEA